VAGSSSDASSDVHMFHESMVYEVWLVHDERHMGDGPSTLWETARAPLTLYDEHVFRQPKALLSRFGKGSYEAQPASGWMHSRPAREKRIQCCGPRSQDCVAPGHQTDGLGPWIVPGDLPRWTIASVFPQVRHQGHTQPPERCAWMCIRP